MKYCTIQIKTQTSTFRIPEFQNFHKSLYLPPPTTLIGFAGAALGLSPKESQDYFNENDFKMGVYGISQGITKDLWKYRKLNKDTKKNKRLFIQDILTREILIYNEFVLVYGNENEKVIESLSNSINNPKYALTLGSSDSLVKVIDICVINEIIEFDEISHCIIEGDIINEVLDNSLSGLDFSIYTTTDPICYDLPVEFEYESNYGIRRVVKRKKYSFIGERMKLNVKKKGVICKDLFIPLFNIN